MDFYCYENWAHGRSGHSGRIHKGNCSHCNDGRGTHGKVKGATENGHWLGAFRTVREAHEKAALNGARVIRTCQICLPLEEEPPPPNGEGKPKTQDDPPPPVTLDDLTLWRRGIIQLLNAIDNDPSKKGVVSRINSLSHAGRIPRETASLMVVVVEMRNAGEYEKKNFSHIESEASRYAWKAVVEWAYIQGVELKP